jgi:putative ABC transport system permease protein
MIVGLRDASKLVSILIISCCAVFVTSLFLNYNMDIVTIEEQITTESIKALYNAQVSTGKVVSAVSGGCLLTTSVIMLFFYIKHYIDIHRTELGILKALGYSNLKIARGFWVFGLSVFAGTAIGFSLSFALLPTFYIVMNEDNLLPDIAVRFHPSLAVCLVILPGLIFSLLSCLYSYHKLKCPALELLRGKAEIAPKRKADTANKNLSFLNELKQSTVRSQKSLAFFITFASFCYSSMMQMSFSMNELASEVFVALCISIGIILACTTLFLAITTVVAANTKTIALMRAFGYSLKDCCNSILNGYRPLAYIGFAIGTAYQYALLKITVYVVFREVAIMPDYTFNFPALIITFVSFALIYEFIMYCYSRRIRKISLKDIMME